MTMVSYAQNFEDVMLWRALGHVQSGFYVDVGAQRPDVDSVTRLFYDLGWRGINIEPVEQWHRELVDRRPRDINVNVAAGRSEGEIELRVFSDTGLSTAVDAFASDHAERGFVPEIRQVRVRTLQSICEEFHVAPIHFLKIDVEGFECDVLAGLDLDRVRPWVVVVEATLPNSRITNFEAWEGILLGADYQFAYFDGLNRFYVAVEHSELLQSFAAPPNVFDDFTLSGTASNPFSTRLLDRTRALEDDLAKVTAEADVARAEAARRSAESAGLEARIAALVEVQGQLAARNRDVEFELSIARKRLAADTRALIARDERIRALEVRFDDLSAGWQEVLDNAIARFDGSVEGQVDRLANLHDAQLGDLAGLHEIHASKFASLFEAHGAQQTSLVEGIARLESTFGAQLAEAARRIDEARAEGRVLAVDLADTRAELTASLATSHHWYQMHESVAASLQATQHRLAEVHDSNHVWFTRSTELAQLVARMEASRSWRTTAPLRACRRAGIGLAKAVIKPPVFLAIRIVRRSPRLWSYLSNQLKSHPAVFSRLKASAVAAGVVPAPPIPPPPRAEAGVEQSQPPERADLSAHQLRILRRIRPGA